ncbi:hypothetical protein LOTGIDRAFT_168965 [Lottia gigantea]|uniref:G8 domain-containing protein n=1 Tax=Lottia gigantea TaxID=225164 RepID=V3ZHN6_LOTGI|nr:hypothetical protein LOTGIDRAFT_168965 [Lottia gigantea]ESO83722.1 hypothetical protein LOTGIDRAFT_168965 [Lottia gigantea]
MCSITFHILLILAWSSISTVFTMCPDQIEGLIRWSDPTTWPNNMKPGHNSEVYIDSAILMDESPPKLHSIVIQPGGRLVWSCEDDYTMYVDFILIHGRMDIGSEDCKYTRKAKIILTGIRGDYEPIFVGEHDFGEKFIGVAPGGTLELHGDQKLSWTKLVRTIPKLDYHNGLIYSHMNSDVAKEDSCKPGLLVYILDEHTGHPEFGKYYHLGGSDIYQSTEHLPELLDVLYNLEDGKILTLAVNKNAVDLSIALVPLYDALEYVMYGMVNGLSQIRQLGSYDAYTLVAQKGAVMFNEDVSPNHGTYTQYARSDLTFYHYGMKIIMESFIDNQDERKSKVDLRVATLYGAYPVLDLLDDVSSWNVGDKIVLTSTDFDWQQTEEAIIVECPHCLHNQITVEMDSKFMHWGEIVDRVDERGEVALLTRNIVIEGQIQNHCPPENNNCDKFNYDTFGGHIKFVRGFRDVHVEGVELYHMGQQTGLGTYPLHFHMAYETGDREHPPYLKDNSVHKSYARCYTIHGTHGITLKRNVGYDSLGHCYFLEDGGEMRTVLDGNIGFSTRKAGLIPSDSKPSTFWITNPLTYLRNNVAAGSEYVGIWHIFPDEPVGLTVGLPGFMERYEAKHTAYNEWRNNVAHSNPFAGLYIDEIVNPDDTVGGENGYSPREDPFDPSSRTVTVDIIKPTLYKNRYQNAWIRGGGFNVVQGSFADSANGITFARSTDQVQYIRDSVIIGETRNIGEPTSYWEEDQVVTLHRAFPMPEHVGQTIRGIRFYDSSVYVYDVWFSEFQSDDYRDAGAISFMNDKPINYSTYSTVDNIQFAFADGESSGNRIFDSRWTGKEHGADISFHDIDGSVSGISGAEIFRIGASNLNHLCHWRENWNVAVCPPDEKSRPGSLSATSFWPPAVTTFSFLSLYDNAGICDFTNRLDKENSNPYCTMCNTHTIFAVLVWGAGLTISEYRLSTDGGFSEWTAWGSCYEDKDLGFVQWRYRACTEPIPEYYGVWCYGPTSESRSCVAY